MSTIVRWSVVIVLSTVVALGAVGLVGVTWNDRADDICQEHAPGTATGYSVTWEWSEAAYVCDYRTPDRQTKRVGIIDAFHGEGRRPHRR